MFDCKGNMVEKKDRVRALMLDMQCNNIMKVSIGVSKSESSLINKIFYEIYNEFRSIHGDLGDLLHDNGRVSRFTMFIGSTNPLSKECPDDLLIGTAVTKDLTDVSDTEENLREENDLINTLFAHSKSAKDRVITSETHMRDHAIVSAEILSKI